MSLIPYSASVPSESTIEQIANHQILSLLSPFGSWFYVPTKREEKTLGYDASLQNHKALVIQYKRLKLSGTGARISLSTQQHSTLMGLFPRSHTPYVFYAFALHRNYENIATLFSDGFGFLFGLETIYVDAHSIPAGSLSISIRFDPNLSCTARKTNLHFWQLPALVRQFQACNLGLRSELLLEPPFNKTDSSKGKTLPNLNIMWARVR